jgi:Ca2+-binding EF-hand superfamily protein
MNCAAVAKPGDTMDLRKHLYTLACSVIAAGAAGPAQAADNAQTSWFKVLDRDDDGSVSLAELQTVRNTRFFNLDADKDLQLTQRETAGNADWAGRFSRLDSNEDGHVSLREFETKGRTRFQAIDDNRDGRITPAEALSFQRKVRQHWERNLRSRKTG